MTIRTNDKHEELNGHSLIFAKYLPVELAYVLPCIFQMLGKNLNDAIQRDEAMAEVSNFLDVSKEAVCIGFKKKNTMSDLHNCKIEFCDNVRTFSEDKEGINGKPSIGIQFKDADDGYNDWIWIATDVLMSFKYDEIFSSTRMLKYIKAAATFFGKSINNATFENCIKYANAKENLMIDITDFSGGKSLISLNEIGCFTNVLTDGKEIVYHNEFSGYSNIKPSYEMDRYIRLSSPTFKLFENPQKLVLNPNNILKVVRGLVPMKRLVYSDNKHFFGLSKKRVVDVETYRKEIVTKVVTVDREVFYVKETIEEIDELISKTKLNNTDSTRTDSQSTPDNTLPIDCNQEYPTEK